MSKDTTRDIIHEVINDNLDYLVRFAHFRVGSHSLAEDIVHDAILRLIERGTAQIPSSSLRLYLFRIVYNMCQDHLRHNNDAPLQLDTIDTESLIDREEHLDNEEAHRINSLLASLPTHEAEIIRMRVVDELAFTDISDILDCPASTVKSRFKSGMDKLRVCTTITSYDHERIQRNTRATDSTTRHQSLGITTPSCQHVYEKATSSQG